MISGISGPSPDIHGASPRSPGFPRGMLVGPSEGCSECWLDLAEGCFGIGWGRFSISRNITLDLLGDLYETYYSLMCYLVYLCATYYDLLRDL